MKTHKPDLAKNSALEVSFHFLKRKIARHFISRIALFGIFIFLLAPSLSAQTKYEAENGTLGGGTQIQNDANALNGRNVGYFANTGAYVQFNNVTAPAAGTYSILIAYSNGSTYTAFKSIYVNGQQVQQVSFPVTGGWSAYWATMVSAYLNTTNTVKISRDSSDTAGTNIDYIIVSKAPQPLSQKYEAEAGVLGGGTAIQNDTNASGGRTVGNFASTGANVQINNVTAPSAGTSSLAIVYSNGNTYTASKTLYVNGVKACTVSFPATGSWSTYSTATANVYLSTSNTVKISRDSTDTAGTNVDYISTGGSPFTWGNPIGSNIQLWLANNQSPTYFSPLMNLAQNGGLGWNRDGFTWHALEPQAGVWDFRTTDTAVAACLARGIRVIGLLGYGNPAYGYTDVFKAPQTPAQSAAFENYVYTVANRYKGLVDVWEVWNEPDLQEFLVSSNYLADYEKILSIAAPAIKRANPNAVVLGPATSAEPLLTIQSMINDGSIQYLDGISFHTYTYQMSNEKNSEPRVASLSSILAQNSINKPLIVTETGFSTYISQDGVDLQRQADLTQRAYVTLLSRGVKVVAGYNFRNLTDDTAEKLADIQHNWGWTWFDLTPKPVFYGMQNMASLLATRSFSKALPLSTQSGAAAPKIKALAFTDANGRTTVALWSWDELYDSNWQLLQCRDYTVNIVGFVKSTSDSLCDWEGNALPLTPVTGGYTLTVGPSPVYLTGNDLIHASVVVQDVNAPPIPAPINIVVDNTSTGSITITGAWTSSTSSTTFYGTDYLHDGNSEKGSKSVTYTPNLPETGYYDVYMRWSASSNRASSVRININGADGMESVDIDQKDEGGTLWALIGRFKFAAGTDGSVAITNAGSSGYVIADAVRFVKPRIGTEE